MGQNAYFVNVGIRGSHSLVEDSCVNCHMEQTPPPALLSYNQGGTNHTFFASDQICSNCHGVRREDLSRRVRVYEIDHPDVQALKRDRVAAAGRSPASLPTFVPVDFETTSFAAEIAKSDFHWT